MSENVVPFVLDIAQSSLDDLQQRLRLTRWPDRETVQDWSQGVPLAKAQAFVNYWATQYDWRRCEAALNGLGQFRTEIDGLGIHFLHIRSPHARAMPLLLTHGWPGSVVEFSGVIGPLADPAAHGGSPDDAFHLVIPSLPGFGFSDKPAAPGWNLARVAAAWNVLMHRLGYDRYVAQGGDWGAIVTAQMGMTAPAGLLGVHLNMLLVAPGPDDDLTGPEARAAIEAGRAFQGSEMAYALLQASKPQTLGYGLADSPAGQAMWIYEKFHGWSDGDGDPEAIFARDALLDNIMLYWLTNSGASAARMYWENQPHTIPPFKIDLPVGCSIFPKEISCPPRQWAQRYFSNIIHWNRLDKGGHFAALEQPDRFVSELRTCFRRLR